MSRIGEHLETVLGHNRKALIPFITAGYPHSDITVPMMHTLVESGADIIELGVPFSDPMADGPIIQKAGEQALELGMSLAKVLEMVTAFRRQDQTTPVVLMGYLNPIEAMGYETFNLRAAEAGVDGVLIVDLPPEEAKDWAPQLITQGIDPIFLLAPTSSDERIQQVAERARGYVYYVSLKGVTGSAALNIAAVEEKLLAIRQWVNLPVGVGFGIKDAASAAAIARVADAAVVGSVLVELMGTHADDRQTMHAAAGDLINGMRKAMDAIQ